MPAQSDRRANEWVQLRAPFDVTLQLDEISLPVPADHLLIRCHYSLISPGSELSFYTGSHGGLEDRSESNDPYFPGFRYPIAPGYAAVGEVEEVGAGIDGFAPGNLVYYPGKHRRLAIVSPATTPVLHVPSGVAPHLAPFARLAQIAATALEVTEAGDDDVVAVLSLGMIGNLAAQLFRIRGARVVAADLIGFRRDLATRAGIEHTIDASTVDVTQAILHATGGDGARAVIEATGNPKLVETALRMVAKRGDVVLLGSPMTASRGDDALNTYMLHLIHRTGARVIGAHESIIPQVAATAGVLDQRQLARTALDLIGNGQLAVEHLVSGTVRPGEIEDAYRSLLNERDRALTMLIDWTDP